MSQFKIVTLSVVINIFCLVVGSNGNEGFPPVTLPENYDSAKPPISNGKPVTIFFKLFIQTIAPIISSEMEFRVNARMTMSWEDHRLALNLPDDSDDCNDSPIIIPKEIASGIWHPDPYVVNAKYTGIKKFTRTLVNMYIFENHTVLYTMILNATVACSMNFRFYPLDIQMCPLLIQSFSYDDSIVRFKWDPYTPFYVKPSRLIQFFVVTPPPPEEHFDFQIGPGRNFTELVATFRFERQIGSHLMQTFIPCSLVVTLSWFSFWLELDVIAARGSLLMTSVLTLVTHFSALRLELPPVAYVKAVDIWMFGCTFWVFAALAEFIVVKVMYTIADDVRKENQVYSLRKSADADGMFFKVSGLRDNNNGAAGITPYTAFWLWDELLTLPGGGEPVIPRSLEKVEGCYNKKRLGSVLLSGRSTATLNLPILNKRVWIFRLPLVWNGLTGKALLWREIDGICKWFFPISFTIFCIVYWTALLIHAFLI